MEKTEKMMEKFFKNRIIAWIITFLIIISSFAHAIHRDNNRIRSDVYNAFEFYIWPIMERGLENAYNIGIISQNNGIENDINTVVLKILDSDNIIEISLYYQNLSSIIKELEIQILNSNFTENNINFISNLIVNFEESLIMLRQSNYNNIARNFNQNLRFMGSEMPIFE